MKVTQATLDRLNAIYEAGGDVPEDLDPFAFYQEILPLLGSTDGPLRERKVLGVLFVWIKRRVLNDEQIRAVLRILLDEDHLFLGIGESDTDTIYMRAFVVFLLTAFIQAHQVQAFLPTEELEDVRSAVLRFLEDEMDLRGYISPETWWGHAVAHAADVVRDLAGCEEFGANALAELLKAATKAMLVDTSVFVYEEDTRIAAAILAILKRGILSNETLTEWSESMIPEARWTGELPRVHHRYVNARNLLRCLIHQGQSTDLDSDILQRIEKAHASLPER